MLLGEDKLELRKQLYLTLEPHFNRVKARAAECEEACQRGAEDVLHLLESKCVLALKKPMLERHSSETKPNQTKMEAV